MKSENIPNRVRKGPKKWQDRNAPSILNELGQLGHILLETRRHFVLGP